MCIQLMKVVLNCTTFSIIFFFFSSRRRHTRSDRDWSSDVCSSDLIYGILERQFRGTFAKAERQQGITGENLLRILERRLDNVVYRIGFAASRREARLLVNHGHYRINGRKVNRPSFLVKEGDVI